MYRRAPTKKKIAAQNLINKKPAMDLVCIGDHRDCTRLLQRTELLEALIGLRPAPPELVRAATRIQARARGRRRREAAAVRIQARARGRAVRAGPLHRLWRRYLEEREIRMRLEGFVLRRGPRGPATSTRMWRS
jgi:hypothetical protein